MAKKAKKRNPLDLVPVHREDLEAWQKGLLIAAETLASFASLADNCHARARICVLIAERIDVALRN